MRKMKEKKGICLFLVLVFWLIAVNSCLAGNYIPGVDPVLPSGNESTKVSTTVYTTIGTLMWIGFAISLGMLIFVGIKYVMSAAEEKANMKGVLVKVIVGTIIVAGATTIFNIALSVFGE